MGLMRVTRVATTQALPSHFYREGALVASIYGAFPQIDGIILGLNDSILVKDESDARYNGVYELTTPGTSYTLWQLTRRRDFDEATDVIQNAVIQVLEGETNGKTQWLLETAGKIKIGTTPLTFRREVDLLTKLFLSELSDDLIAGDWFCSALNSDPSVVTKAIPKAVAAAGGVIGVATGKVKHNTHFTDFVLTGGVISSETSGLGPGAPAIAVLRNPLCHNV